MSDNGAPVTWSNIGKRYNYGASAEKQRQTAREETERKNAARALADTYQTNLSTAIQKYNGSPNSGYIDEIATGDMGWVGYSDTLARTREQITALGIPETESPHKELIDAEKTLAAYDETVAKSNKSMEDAGIKILKPGEQPSEGYVPAPLYPAWYGEKGRPMAAAMGLAPKTRPSTAATGAPAGSRAASGVAGTVAGKTYGQQQRFRQQCYLLSRIKRFAKFSATLHSGYVVDEVDRSRKLPYFDGVSNTSIPVVGEPFGLMNKLIGNSKSEELNNLTTAQISALIPLLRIFKVHRLPNGTERHNEILFDTHVTRTDMTVFESRSARGAGSGLNSFDITFDGSNFFTAKKAIKAKLSMHFDSFNDIIRIRRSNSGQTFRYVDLALRTSSASGGKKDPNRDSFPESYRIKVIAGWSVPRSGLDKELFKDQELRTAIENSSVIFNLTMVSHTFNVDDLGRVTFDIDYMAYIDAAFSTKYANVLTNTDLMEKYLKRESTLRIISKSDCTSEEKSKLKKELSLEAERDKKTALKTLLEKLGSEKKIFYHIIPMAALDSFNKLGPWAEDDSLEIEEGENFVQNDVEKDILNIIDAYDKKKDLPENLTGLIRRPTSNKEYILPFFFLGDLLDAGLGNISEYTSDAHNIASGNPDVDGDFLSFSHSFQGLRILTGDIELVEPKTGAIYRANMADVPVSIDYFVEWFMGKVISKGGEPEYPLSNFVKDLMNSILTTAGDAECFGSSAISKVHARVSYLSGLASVRGADPATMAASKSGMKRIDIDEITQKGSRALIRTSDSVDKLATESKPTYQYIVFYASRAYPHNRKGHYVNDAQVGIPHFEIGRGEGMVKNIQFQKAEQKYFKEMMLEQEGYEGLAQVREPYAVTITMFGNLNYFPGSYIYVDPRGLGSMMGSPQDDKGDDGYGSLAWQLGMGGYYMITKTASKITSGIYETTLYATWVARGGRHDPELAPSVMAEAAEDCESLPKQIDNVSLDERGKFDRIGIVVTPNEAQAGDVVGYVENSRTGEKRYTRLPDE